MTRGLQLAWVAAALIIVVLVVGFWPRHLSSDEGGPSISCGSAFAHGSANLNINMALIHHDLAFDPGPFPARPYRQCASERHANLTVALVALGLAVVAGAFGIASRDRP